MAKLRTFLAVGNVGLLLALVWLTIGGTKIFEWIYTGSQGSARFVLDAFGGEKSSANCSCPTLSLAEATVAEIRRSLHPPSKDPYKLKEPDRTDFSQFGESVALVKQYFGTKRNGTFIECGAHEGERLSNTLAAERDLGWSGLLIEPERQNFQALKSKNRKAFLLNACIDLVEGGVVLRMEKWAEGKVEKAMIGQGPGVRLERQKKPSHKPFNVVCYNFRDVLAAADLKHIDWLNLDMEGNEIPALISFPWESVSVDVIQVEGAFPGTTRFDETKGHVLKSFLDQLGFEEAKPTKLDYVFVRKAFLKSA